MSYFCEISIVLKTLKNKIQYRIVRSKGSVFMLKDFLDLSDRDQVGRVLRQLITKGVLIKIGQGLYAKTRCSSLTGKVILYKSLPELTREALSKLKIKVYPSKAEQMYESGKSTQVPTGRVIAVKGRVKRKISYAGVTIKLEHVS